jgi:hypothetical protein
MGFAPRHDTRFTIPGLPNGNRQACRAPKSKEPHSFTRLNSRNSQATKADDAGAQQGSGGYIVQTCWQGKCEVCAHEDILGIVPVHRISSERRPITRIFYSVKTVPAVTIYTAHPRDSDMRSDRQLRCLPFDHLSYDLMTRNRVWPDRWQVLLNDVQISTTNATGNNFEHDVPGLKLWTRNVLNFKDLSRYAPR